MIRKIFFFGILIVFFFSFTANASKGGKTTIAKFPQTTIESRNIMRSHLFGKIIFSGALTSGPEYNGGFGMQGMLDYRFKNRVSAGIQVNLYFLKSDISSTRQLGVNLRTNYHLIKEIPYKSNDWDWYIGADLGGDIVGGNKEVTAFNEFIGIHTGLRYKLNYKWMVFIEIGSRNTSFGLAYSF